MHVFLSYPKSGRTWVRFMVDDYLCRLLAVPVPNVFEIEKLLAGTDRHIEWTHLTGAMIMRRAYYEMGPIDVRQAEACP